MTVPNRRKEVENKQKEIDFEIKQTPQINNTKGSSENEEIAKDIAYFKNLTEAKKNGTKFMGIYNK